MQYGIDRPARRSTRLVGALLLLVLAAVIIVGCGSSSGSGDANSLLRQTFSGSHTVNSGNLNFALTVSPSGSNTLTSPITISFGGPFQSQGKGKLPKSNFVISFSAQGKTGSLGIVSTGAAGYVTLQGTSYQLPAATFQKLESSFASLASSPGGTGGTGALSKLGIDPMHWLTAPSVVGSENVGGADTTHIRAGVNVAALLTDLNTFLQKASSLGVAGASRITSGISAASRQRIASAVKNPTFDVWTGTGDKTVRKLTIRLMLPVTGQVSTALGGLNAADIGLTMQYANLNQPQSIVAPGSVHPFAEFQSKLHTIVEALQGSLGSAGLSGGGTTSGSAGLSGGGTTSGTTGSSGGGTTSGTTGGSSGASSTISSYSQCIQSAGGDVSKMQQCASLLNGKAP